MGVTKTLCQLVWFVATAVCVLAASVGQTRAATDCDGTGPAPGGGGLLVDIAQSARGYVAVGKRGRILIVDAKGERSCLVLDSSRKFLTSADFPSPEYGWVVGYDGFISHTKDGGLTWDVQRDPASAGGAIPEPLFSVRFVDTLRGVAAGAYGSLAITEIGGRTWTETGLAGSDGVQEERHIYSLLSLGGASLLAVGESGEPADDLTIDESALLYRTDDAGRTWTKLTAPYFGSLFGGIALDAERVLLFGLLGNMYLTEDGGKAWRKVDSKTKATLLGAAAASDGTIYISGLNGTVLRYRWGEPSATAMPFGGSVIQEFVQPVLVADEGKLAIVGNMGVEVFDLAEK